MKSKLRMIASVLILSLANTGAFAAADLANTFWKTIDDVTGKPKAIIEMSETGDHELRGTIVKIFPRPGLDQHELCNACKGDLHDKPIVGMTVLHHLKQDKETAGRYEGGEILDPSNGKTYRCSVQLSDNNQQMNVRGYIGLQLFGRSQVWHRVKDING